MLKNRTVEYLRQHRIILRADAASEVHQLLSKKRREYFAYYRAFFVTQMVRRSRRSGV